MRPAQQGLDADQLTVDGVDDRLIFDVQLVAFTSAGQAPRQTGVVLGEVLPAQVEDVMVAAALAFGPVHRNVGVVDELFGRVASASGEGDADARADRQLRAREDERLGQRLIEADGDLVSVGAVDEVFAEDDELVSGQARHAVTRP